MDVTTITLPIAPNVFWFVAAVLGIGVLSALIAVFWPARHMEGKIQTSGGKTRDQKHALKAVIYFFAVVGAAFAVPTVLGLLGGIVMLMHETLTTGFDSFFTADGGLDKEAQREFTFNVLRLAGLTTVLGAVIALPFTIYRLRLTREQTDTATQGLITDRINAAVEQLGHDSAAVRTGAILQLERIIRDSPRDKRLVQDMLNAYIQEKQQLSARPGAITNTPIDVQAALDVMLRHS